LGDQNNGAVILVACSTNGGNEIRS